ncbi:MAG TPA: DUF4147 domain-containing protein [Gemmatimonadaceae bacterium]|nr:DUF4147 domain-containing protein [Gemmatimonadaceae bacterium]
MSAGSTSGDGAAGADARALLTELYRAAVAGANVESLTAKAVATVPMERRHRVWILAIGKAAYVMARAAVGVVHRGVAEVAGGIVVGPDEAEAPDGNVSVVVGDHPVPGNRSFTAAAQIQRMLKQKRADDVFIVLLSGGASSLIGAPMRGITETEFSRLYEMVLASGLDIHDMNAIRKRFSLWGAGRLALKLAPNRTHCFAVSDVTGDDLGTIGSGPVVPDPTTAQEVIDLLKQVKLFTKVAPGFRTLLTDTVRGAAPETPKSSHPAFAHVEAKVIANNAGALRAVAKAARKLGANPVVHDNPVTGAAADAGVLIAEQLLSAREAAASGSLHCVVWGGETTVALDGAAPPGGRCQELALAAARHLSAAGDRASGITLLAAGTDGRDGDTDAAGAIVDAGTWRAIGAAGLDADAALRKHESHAALSATGALFRPGLTGTNVMDVMIGWIRR